jgi:hypothetical protein
MKNLIESLEKSIENRNWYGVLFIALTLPDICGKIDYPNEKPSLRFIIWFKKYIEPKYTDRRIQWPKLSVLKDPNFDPMDLFLDSNKFNYISLTGEECYQLRCAYLHEGSDDITNPKSIWGTVITKFHFRTPKYAQDGSKGGNVHNNLSNDYILQLQIDIFGRDILDGVNEWMNSILSDDPRHQMLTSRLKIYEGGSDEGPPIF